MWAYTSCKARPLNRMVMDMPEWTRDGAIPQERAVRVIASDAVRTFEGFFECERIRLYRALFAVTGSRSEAEDIAQDAFLKVWGERWDRVGRMDEREGNRYRRVDTDTSRPAS